MKTIIIAITTLLAISTASAGNRDTSEAFVDKMLANRDTMAAAVALLATIPPKCTVDDKRPTSMMIARFAVSYGYTGDASFMAAVKAKRKEYDELGRKKWASEQEKLQTLKFLCAVAMLYSAKIRDLGITP
jgi:hypothetical protein